MPDSEPTYTYRAGEKVSLEKEPDQFVVRALPDTLREMGVPNAERLSSHSSRVRTSAANLELHDGSHARGWRRRTMLTRIPAPVTSFSSPIGFW